MARSWVRALGASVPRTIRRMRLERPPPPEHLSTRTAQLWLADDGIVREWDLPGLEQGLPDAEENMGAVARLSVGTRRPLLVDMSQVKAISREARVYYAGPEVAKVISAVALLVGSPLSRAIGNFFIGFNRAAVPIRLFGSEADAVAWLSGYLERPAA